jgi:hypothetical protein
MNRLKARRRRQGGWILLMVMMMLTALALGVTAYYTESEDHLFTGQSLSAYQLAASRAEHGAQLALARIRSNMDKVTNLKDPCDVPPGADPFVYCPAVNAPFLGGDVTLVDNKQQTKDSTLRTGDGLQYKYIIYKPVMAGDPAKTPINLFTIRAVGYYGYDLNSQNLYTSEVEIQTDVGNGISSTCSNADDYGC